MAFPTRQTLKKGKDRTLLTQDRQQKGGGNGGQRKEEGGVRLKVPGC